MSGGAVDTIEAHEKGTAEQLPRAARSPVPAGGQDESGQNFWAREGARSSQCLYLALTCVRGEPACLSTQKEVTDVARPARVILAGSAERGLACAGGKAPG